ncbi:hypothetical protein C8Q75DRAFT_314644 [Abortiporus biennis]|nr:hypothetical protein C8Q75DRAFT_314644 [Abortiporus biennis]
MVVVWSGDAVLQVDGSSNDWRVYGYQSPWIYPDYSSYRRSYDDGQHHYDSMRKVRCIHYWKKDFGYRLLTKEGRVFVEHPTRVFEDNSHEGFVNCDQQWTAVKEDDVYCNEETNVEQNASNCLHSTWCLSFLHSYCENEQGVGWALYRSASSAAGDLTVTRVVQCSEKNTSLRHGGSFGFYVLGQGIHISYTKAQKGHPEKSPEKSPAILNYEYPGPCKRQSSNPSVRGEVY